jgi:hypothetical protein
MTDALPWWILAVASIGTMGRWFRNATMALGTLGVAVNLVGIVGPMNYWDSRPSIDWFPDRARSVADSQIALSILASVSTYSTASSAIEAEQRGELQQALDLWGEEWEKHGWNQFAAFQIADLLLRTNRLEEAALHARDMAKRWPESSYVRHLVRYLPRITDILQRAEWTIPIAVNASRNTGMLQGACDSNLNTGWSTVTPQTRSDWLELDLNSDVPVRAVALFSVPAFGHGPSGLDVVGTTILGEQIALKRRGGILARRKGWVVVGFPPTRLERLSLRPVRNHGSPWTVTEVRLLTEVPGVEK